MNYKLGWILLLSLASLAFLNLQPTQTESEFTKWTQTYSKKYSSKIEYIYREMVFMRNLEKINRHNADPTQTYTMGVNQFADLTQEEFVSRYLSPSQMKDPIKFSQSKTFQKNIKSTKVNADIDWLAAGKVSLTRQGTCGSIWAFPTVSVIESALLAYEKPKQLLSIQQIIDCSEDYGNYGCMGAVYPSLDFIIANGLTTEQLYPYVGYEQLCLRLGGLSLLQAYFGHRGCPDIIAALAFQPILTAVDATNWAFYKSGVFSNCEEKEYNQVVIIIGWREGEYWTVMNNWGQAWGENGMIRLAPGNTCAVCTIGVQPILKDL